MASACDEINLRLTELLYGELPAEARAEIEAHVGGCARCQTDLAALQRTRELTRQALAADEPPARAHHAILRAAAAAVAAKQAPIAARPAPPPASFWDWFRKRWTWPTFATVGAVAVVALASKIFLEPENTVQRGREILRPPAASAPAAAAPPPLPAAEPAPVEKKAAVEKDPEDRATQAQPASSAVRRTSLANSHAKGGKGSLGSGAALRGGPAGDLGASEGFAPPPPAMKPAKRAVAPEPELAKKAAEAPALDGFADTDLERKRDEAPGRAGGGAPASSRAAAAPKMKKEAAAPAPAAASVAASAEEESATDSAVGSPVARADRLFAQGRWADAARAYRELLRRDPRNADAARWRQRLAAAEAALAP